ncbi:MAG TPA: 2-amino-4-oxopentanoate thiolase subunit OrtA, partial [Tissierellaceae bacterium]
MTKAVKNDWVEVENVVLKPEERAAHLPEDTKATPLMMWTKGFLIDDEAEIGDEV